MLCFAFLLAFSFVQQPIRGGSIIEFIGPEPLLHWNHPNATMELFCHTEGESGWHVNGTFIGTVNKEVYEKEGFIFTSESRNTDPPQYIRNATVTVFGHNETVIGCVVIGEVGGDNSSFRNVKILIAGPPLPPSPELRAVNATTLQLSWEDPFTVEGFGIDYFTVSVKRLNYEEETHVIFERGFYLSRVEGIVQTCEESDFTVTATNAVGESETADISGEFPIAPGQFQSLVEYEVNFDSDGTPQLKVCFLPPQICRSQSSNFTITVQKLVDSGAPLTVYTTGPVRYTSSSGVETRNISSGLETNEAYTLTVLFSTVAGDSSSSANFSIHTHNSDTTWIIYAASGAVSAVVLVLGIGIIATCAYLKRRAKQQESDKDKLAASPQGMVPNPLYEGPLYDFISDSSQLRALSRERAKESCYVDIPARVIIPKQEKDDKTDQGYENIKLSAKVGTNFVVASSSAEEAYTVMKPAGTLKGYATTQEELEVSSPESAADDKSRYVLGE